MTRRLLVAPKDETLDQQILALGVAPSTDTRALLRRLATNPADLHRTIAAIASSRTWDDSVLPDVDEVVTIRMRAEFQKCVNPTLLVKAKKIGAQNRLLLAYLIEHLGQPVPLQELLLVSGLKNGTSRRIRELKTEHGHFDITVSGTGDTTAYTLRTIEPDLGATAYYWLRHNIRQRKPARISPHERLVALLSARLGKPVPLDDLAYVLPKSESSGKGRPRSPQLAVARRIRELRERGWQVHAGGDRTHVGLTRSDYILPTLTKIPEYERIPAKMWDKAMLRAGRACEVCGWKPSDGPSAGRGQLQVHHEIPQRDRPVNVHDLENLQVLCNIDHAGRESRFTAEKPPLNATSTTA